MGAAYFGMVRRAATAWTDMLVDMEQRFTNARAGIRDTSKGYGYNELMRDTLEVWVSGMQTWERMWMPGSTQPVPVVLLKAQDYVGDAVISPPVDKANLRWTSLGHLGAGRPIPHDEVDVKPSNGMLRISIVPKGKQDRAPGLYRGVVYADEAGTPRVVADIVVEVPERGEVPPKG